MDGDPTPALTGRRRTRPTSTGCRNPWQPKPGRAPLIAAYAAVQINRATSLISAFLLSRLGTFSFGLIHTVLKSRFQPIPRYCYNPTMKHSTRRKRTKAWLGVAFEPAMKCAVKV